MSKDVNSFTSIDYDPDAAARFLPEEAQKAQEASQAQSFREQAFVFAISANLCIFIVWLALMSNMPEEGSPDKAYYLWGLKTSLATGSLLILGISTMRFAIRCYGHHHQAQ